jgi:hypothetical protein
MAHELLKKHLEQAERRVLDADRHVMRQRDLVAELERDGHDTTEANTLLRRFEELLVLHIQVRDRLRKELG